MKLYKYSGTIEEFAVERGRIQGVSDDFRKPAPRIDLDGRNLNEREQHQNHPATAPEQFFQIHSHPPH